MPILFTHNRGTFEFKCTSCMSYNNIPLMIRLCFYDDDHISDRTKYKGRVGKYRAKISLMRKVFHTAVKIVTCAEKRKSHGQELGSHRQNSPSLHRFVLVYIWEGGNGNFPGFGGNYCRAAANGLSISRPGISFPLFRRVPLFFRSPLIFPARMKGMNRLTLCIDGR